MRSFVPVNVRKDTPSLEWNELVGDNKGCDCQAREVHCLIARIHRECSLMFRRSSNKAHCARMKANVISLLNDIVQEHVPRRERGSSMCATSTICRRHADLNAKNV
jgi:hypothetical protein